MHLDSDLTFFLPILQIAVFYRVKCKADEKTSISQVLIDYRVNQWQKWSMTFEF